METTLQVLVGLSCLFLAGLGLRTMFTPHKMFGVFAVETETPAGLSTIRGFLGGLFFGSSAVLATGLVSGNTTFFLTIAITMTVVVVGRSVGLASDGFDKKAAALLVAEVAMAAIFFGAYSNL